MQKATFTVKELSQYMGVSLALAYELTEREGFPLLRMGRKKVIPIEQLNRWMNEQCQKKEV